MTDTSELVKRLNDNASLTEAEAQRREAAQAIERLEASEKAADKLAIEAWNKTAKLEENLAEARARDEDRQEAIRAVLKVLPTQREPHPDDNLQKLVNLACSLLDDAFTDYAPEALATPAPIETTGKAAVMDPTIAKKQQESGEAERHTFEPLLAPVEPTRPWQHNYAVCKHCGKTEEACLATQQQESD